MDGQQIPVEYKIMDYWEQLVNLIDWLQDQQNNEQGYMPFNAFFRDAWQIFKFKKEIAKQVLEDLANMHIIAIKKKGRKSGIVIIMQKRLKNL